MLSFKGLSFESLSDCAHSPCHQWHYGNGEEGEFPTDEYKGGEVYEYQYRILYEHVQGTGYGVFDFSDISAHSGDDVSFFLFREITQWQVHEFVIYHHSYVPYNSCADWNHNGRRTEVAGSLHCCGNSEEEAQNQEGE